MNTVLKHNQTNTVYKTWFIFFLFFKALFKSKIFSKILSSQQKPPVDIVIK